jgi:rare lipoprotein A
LNCRAKCDATCRVHSAQIRDASATIRRHSAGSPTLIHPQNGTRIDAPPGVRHCVAVVAFASLAGTCAAPAPAQTRARDIDLPTIRQVREGLASYYAQAFDGRLTASGVRLDLDAMVAAHPEYPFGTLVRVTNLMTKRTVDVRIVDRGPWGSARKDGVIIDLSRAAAKSLALLDAGRAKVRLEVLRWGGDGGEPGAVATSGRLEQ